MQKIDIFDNDFGLKAMHLSIGERKFVKAEKSTQAVENWFIIDILGIVSSIIDIVL